MRWESYWWDRDLGASYAFATTYFDGYAHYSYSSDKRAVRPFILQEMTVATTGGCVLFVLRIILPMFVTTEMRTLAVRPTPML